MVYFFLIAFFLVSTYLYLFMGPLPRISMTCIHKYTRTVDLRPYATDSVITFTCNKCKKSVVFYGSCTIWRTYPGGRCSSSTESFLCDIWTEEKAIRNGTIVRKNDSSGPWHYIP